MRYAFEYVDFPPGAHPNAVRFMLADKHGRRCTLAGNSVGGGRVETTEAQGVPCRYIGDTHLICLRTDATEADCLAPGGALSAEATFDTQGRRCVLVYSETALDADALPGEVVFRLSPILPVPMNRKRETQLFDSFGPWIAYAEAHGITLSEAAVEYERRASGWPREKIVEAMRVLQATMKRQTEAVYADDAALLETPFTGYHFRQWERYESRNAPLAGPVLARAMRYAFGAQALCRGVKLVPGPMGTGGGYLYSVLRAVQDARGLSDEALLEGLFVAAGVGAIAYTRSDPTGEVTGCAGECGMCGAMSAAAVTHLLGGTPRQVEAAASMTLQSAVGWPCDPIPGGHNQPCASRVLTAVCMAVAFSDVALSGRDAVLPFHEVVDAMDALGRRMPSDLLCTSRGGAPMYITIDLGHMNGQQFFQRPDRAAILDSILARRAQPDATRPWLGTEAAHALHRAAVAGERDPEAAADAILADVEANPHLFASPEDGSIWRWVEALGQYGNIVHLQQTDGKSSPHWPFTEKYNKMGVASGEKLIESLAKAYDQPPIPGLPAPAAAIALTLEPFVGTLANPYTAVEEIAASVDYWRRFIPHDGMRLSQARALLDKA